MLFPPTGWWAAAIKVSTAPIALLTDVAKNELAANRYYIATANGLQQLSVPLTGGRSQRKSLLADLRIDYTHSWQRQHWGALYSAYGRSPFFEHYSKDLRAIIHSGEERLEDFCRAGIDWLSKALQVPLSFCERGDGAVGIDWQSEEKALPKYHQVFETRWGFQPGLSAIDLLMNEGPNAGTVLQE